MNLYPLLWLTLQEIFHYKPIRYGEHRKAIGLVVDVPTCRDTATQTSPAEMEVARNTTASGETDHRLGPMRGGEWMDRGESDVDTAEDPRETYPITMPIHNLPYLSSPGVLQRIDM